MSYVKNVYDLSCIVFVSLGFFVACVCLYGISYVYCFLPKVCHVQCLAVQG